MTAAAVMVVVVVRVVEVAGPGAQRLQHQRALGGGSATDKLIPVSSCRQVTFASLTTGRRPSCSPRDTCRCARANRSSCPAVIGAAIATRSDSVPAVAIRVSARTFAYDSRPAANSRAVTGSSLSARATRTCSRAVPGASWHFHASHAAHEPISHDAQTSRASKSATSRRNAHVPAARCPASSQISASRCSSGISAGSSLRDGIKSMFHMGLSAIMHSAMYSTIGCRSDIPAPQRNCSETPGSESETRKRGSQSG